MITAMSAAASKTSARTDAVPAGPAIHVRGLDAFYGATQVLTGVDVHFPAGATTAVVGPAGAGKSTLLRCLNRLHEATPGARSSGAVSLGGLDVYAPGVELPSLRRLVGMVCAAPNLFPTLSIADNVAAGLRLTGARRGELTARTREALAAVGLWDELRSRLHTPAVSLAPGPQQRLCIARTLVLDPAVILMDDPCAALDPAATAQLEALIVALAGRHTIVVGTRSREQAARVAATSVFMLNGTVSEPGDPRYTTSQAG